METTRQERRGKFKSVWNETFKVFQSYQLSKRGVWIMLNNSSSPHLSKHKMNKLINNK
jgi:hypothetical protein